jgi:hypothetical protein
MSSRFALPRSEGASQGKPNGGAMGKTNLKGINYEKPERHTNLV